MWMCGDVICMWHPMVPRGPIIILNNHAIVLVPPFEQSYGDITLFK
jgi:hypothetical protein